MNSETIEAQARQILASVLGIQANRGPLQREGISSWDSLRHVQLIFALEDAFGVRFSEEAMSEMTDLQRIVAQVEACREAQALD